MLPTRLSLALAASLGLAAGSCPAADSTVAAKAEDRGTWLVWLDAPAVARFTGFAGDADRKRAALAPTSPAATGARKLDPASPASLAYREWLGSERGRLLGEASQRLGRELRPSQVYELVGNGFAIELAADEAVALARLPGVRAVEPEFQRSIQTDAGPQWIGAPAIWEGEPGFSGRGEGVVVGVIDTGINRTHPSFAATGPVDGHVHANPRGRFYGRCEVSPAFCNDKLIGIHDFSDEGPGNGLDVDGHGSHVASTAAGNVLNAAISIPGGSQQRQISGVAPHAAIISYKACRADDPETEEDEDGCRGSWLLSAIEQAVEDQVDVINYSIGGSSRDPWSSSDSLAMLDARAAGVITVVAAGNDGPGVGSVTAPGDAPWVLTVANATHDRAVVNRLVDLEGGASTPPGGGVLVGVGQTQGYGPAPLTVPTEAPGCSVGEDLDFPPSGASSPWPGQTDRFSGEIVVCERGVQARVAKSHNVAEAGGGGFVLINTPADGESITADQHDIPGTHLGAASGAALKAWLASGSGHSGRIEGASVQSVPAFADQLAAGSGRGPMLGADYLVPDVTAPGSSILAAAGTGSGYAFLSGTSMATPHVAGAAALLVDAHPGWSVDAVQSVLVATTRPSARMQDGVTPATSFDQGAGVVDLASAVRAGLHLPITAAAYSAANPSSGGDPRTLNEPALIDPDCVESCAFERSVRDLAGGGDWRIVADLPPGLELAAQPATFSIGAGASRTLDFEFTITDPSLTGRWVEGRVTLERVTDDNVSGIALPVALFASPGDLPERIELSSTSEAGHDDLELSGLVALPDARFGATALATPVRTTADVVQDPTRSDPYGPATGTLRRQLTVPAGAGAGWQLVVDASSSSAPDIDLFVGRDDNGDGAADAAEERCASTSSIAVERCAIEITGEAGSQDWWIVVQNWQASDSGSDAVVLEQVLLSTDLDPDSPLVATGPGQVPSQQDLSLRLGWDIPDLLPGERRQGYLLLGADPSSLGTLGRVLVEISRPAAAQQSAAVALVPGMPRAMRLAPGASQDRIYIDVPPNASSLQLRASAAIELHAIHVDADGTLPGIDPAPPIDQADASATGSGNATELSVTGSALSPGRWYLVPHNPGTAEVDFELEVELEYGADAPRQRFGAWFNPARSGAGVFLYPAAGSWALIWYTYLQDGTPTWYLGAAGQPEPGQGVWRVELQRYAWNGSAAHGTPVGEAILSLHGDGEFVFSWNLDGQGGSERYSWIDDGECSQAAGTDLTGSWFDPAQPGFGFSINASEALESNAAYFYDDQGIARWAFGAVAPFGAAQIPMLQYQGPCPLCSYSAPVTQEVGVFERDYLSSSSGTASLEIELEPPLTGSWSSSGGLSRATDALGCN